MTPTDHEIAQAAKDLMDSPATHAAFDTLEQWYIANWKATGFGDEKKREHAWQQLRALENLKQSLTSLADAPKVANFKARQRANTTT